jgi:PadR family transcriptional regulator, regulatory protein PadR
VPRSPDLDVVRGTLDLLVLRTLSWGPMHGLAALRWIEQRTLGDLQIEDGALYPALHRLEQKGWLESEWGYTDAGRRARFYQLTAAGRRHLTAELTRWERYSVAVARVLAPEPAR